MQEIMDLTKNNKKITFNFCMAYGGREEIIDAVSKIVNDVKKGNLKKIDEKELQKRLYIVDEPDFIIRTSGEQRTSNFLMWQSAYSEWFFLNKFWPEIKKKNSFIIFLFIKNFKTKIQNKRCDIDDKKNKSYQNDVSKRIMEKQ